MNSILEYAQRNKALFEMGGISSNEIRFFTYEGKRYILKTPFMTRDDFSPFWTMMRRVFSYSVRKQNGKHIGMGRLVGDGAMYWYLQEIIVLPEFQGLGIGTRIVDYLVDYAVKNSSTGKFTTIGGVSAKGKEGFYQKLGFDVIQNGIKTMIEL